jgi:L-ascorbate metabolism protein UlaG (beta-lactamase superfamily)
MRITKYGHACLYVEDGEAKLLIDPGGFSKDFEDLTDINALLITHEHQDHLDMDKLKALVAANPEMVVYADEASSKKLDIEGVDCTSVHGGDTFEVAAVKVNVYGKDHAVIHPDLPNIPDVGYMIAGRFFYPGDSYTVPSEPVDILAAPVGAPWLKIEEAIDYIRAVKPKVVIPVHDAVLSAEGMQIGVTLMANLGRAGRMAVIENGKSAEF